MADVDTDPFGDHNKTNSHPDDTGETIPLNPGGAMGGGSSWKPEREQETSFGGEKTQERRLTDSYIDSLYKELFKYYNQTLDATHYDNFRSKAKQLYFKGRDEPLTNEDGKLKTFGKLKSILGVRRLHNLGFDVPSGKLTPQQSINLNRVDGELPSTSDVATADDTDLQKITENVGRSTENLTVQLEGESSEDLPMRELLGLDKQLRSIRGSLRVEVARKVQLEERIKKEKCKLEEIRDNPEYDDGI